MEDGRIASAGRLDRTLTADLRPGEKTLTQAVERGMRIAICQAAALPRPREAALDALAGAAREAAASGARWLLAPEFLLPGVASAEALRRSAEPSDGPFARGVAEIARGYRIAVAAGYVESAFGHLFSAALCVDAAGIAVAHYRRVHLQPGEEAHLSPGQWATLAPAGGMRIGLLLGADLLAPEAARLLALSGAALLFGLGAPAGFGPQAVAALAAARAIENGVPLALAAFEGMPAGLFAADGRELSRPGPVRGLRLAEVPDCTRPPLPHRRPELYRMLCAAEPASA
jgi:predicted amidohydrolase